MLRFGLIRRCIYLFAACIFLMGCPELFSGAGSGKEMLLYPGTNRGKQGWVRVGTKNRKWGVGAAFRGSGFEAHGRSRS